MQLGITVRDRVTARATDHAYGLSPAPEPAVRICRLRRLARAVIGIWRRCRRALLEPSPDPFEVTCALLSAAKPGDLVHLPRGIWVERLDQDDAEQAASGQAASNQVEDEPGAALLTRTAVHPQDRLPKTGQDRYTIRMIDEFANTGKDHPQPNKENALIPHSNGGNNDGGSGSH
ncbi:hypothetical protein [Rhodoligotrophos defluvii]|uniref:hypothetical protein n=1 Tax=Rhodoligotrophos defluvii TaxID=2561934 RepID=UPI0010CA078C|nr:hypothetical protein [Rhodoligotrophos defluvii]